MSAGQFSCDDCGVDTNEIGEFYMVTYSVWRSLRRGGKDPHMLCVGCVEARLERPLVPYDFADVPLNRMELHMPVGSDRLRNRMGNSASAWSRESVNPPRPPDTNTYNSATLQSAGMIGNASYWRSWLNKPENQKTA